jgi:hypothetical protein
MLDAGWAAVLVAVEVAVLAGAASAVLSEARREEEGDPRLRDATASARAGFVAPALQDLISAVERARRPEQFTLDGVIPAELFEDALGRMQLKDELARLADSIEVARAPRAAQNRCMRYSRVTASTLLSFAILFPFAIWHPLTGHALATRPWPTLSEIAAAATGALSIAAFTFWISAIRSKARVLRLARGEE